MSKLLTAKQIAFLGNFLHVRPEGGGILRSDEQVHFDDAQKAIVHFQSRREKVEKAIEPLGRMANELGARVLYTEFQDKIKEAEKKFAGVTQATNDREVQELNKKFTEALNALLKVKNDAKIEAEKVTTCIEKRTAAKGLFDSLKAEIDALNVPKSIGDDFAKAVEEKISKAQDDADRTKYADATLKLGEVPALQAIKMQEVKAFGVEKRKYEAAMPRAEELLRLLGDKCEGLPNKADLVKPLSDVITQAKGMGDGHNYPSANSALLHLETRFNDRSKEADRLNNARLTGAPAPTFTDKDDVLKKIQDRAALVKTMLRPLNLMGEKAATDLATAYGKQIDDAEKKVRDAADNENARRRAFTTSVAELGTVQTRAQEMIGKVGEYVSEVKRVNTMRDGVVAEATRIGVPVPKHTDYTNPIKIVLDAAKVKADEGDFRRGKTLLDTATAKQTEALTKLKVFGEKKTTYATEKKKAEGTVKKLELECSALGDATAALKKPIEDLIQEGEHLAHAGGFDEGKAKLDKVAGEYTKQKAKINVYREKQLASAQHKPIYEDKAAHVDQAMKDLADMPGTKDQRDALQKMLDEAKVLVDNKKDYEADYAGAVAKFANYERTVAAAKAAGGTFATKPDVKSFEDARRGLNTAVVAFSKVAALAFPDKIAAAEKAIADGLKKLAEDASQANLKKVADDEAKKLNDLKSDLAATTPLCEKGKTDCDALVKDLAPVLFDHLKVEAPSKMYEPLLKGYIAATAILGAQRYDEAKKQLEDVKDKVNAADVKDLLAAHVDWTEKLKTFQEDKFLEAASRAMHGDAVKLANQLQNELRNLEAKARKTRDYVVCADELDDLLDELNNLRDKVAGAKSDGSDAAAKLSELNTALDQAFKDVQATLTKEVKETNEKLTLLTDQGGDATPFSKRVGDLSREVTDERKKLFSAANLDTWKTDLQKVVADKCTAIRGDIKKVLEDPGKVAESKEAAKKVTEEAAKLKAELEKIQNKKAFEKELSLTWTVLDEMNLEKMAAYAGFLKEVKDIQTEAGVSDYKKEALDKLTAKKGDITTELGKNALARKTAQDKAKVDLAALRTKVTQLESEQAQYKAYAKSLKTQLAECDALLGMDMMFSIEKAQVKLDQLKTEVESSLGDTSKPESIKTVEDRLTKVKRTIEEPALKTFLQSQYKVFQERLKDKYLPTDCRTGTPAQAKKLLDAFETEVTDAVARAKANVAARTRIEALARELEYELNGGTLTGAPTLEASLKKRVASLKTPGENRETVAEIDLKSIKKIIEEVKKPGNKIDVLESNAVKEAADAEAESKKWLGDKAVYKANEQAKAKTKYTEVKAASKANEELYQRIDEVYQLAKKAYTAGNYDEANTKLELAKRNARAFLAEPYDRAISDRNAYKKVNDEWKRSVTHFMRALTELENKIKTDAAPDNKPYDDAKSALDPLVALFDPSIFDGLMEALTNERLSVAAHRTSRESCLRFVREYRAKLSTHKILQLAKENPFKVALKAEEIAVSLRNLELLLLRA